MILAVCLNPALDVTYTVGALRPGASHRVRWVRRRAGGKGINVAAVLHQQGVDALVTGPVGDSIGAELAAGLDRAGVAHRLTPIAAATRQTVTVVDGAGEATVLNEPGPALTADEWSTFRDVFADLAEQAELVTLSGSVPDGIPSDAYGQLVSIAHESGTPVILDCDGEQLVAALHARPDIVKINEHEASGTTGYGTDSVDDVFAAAEELHALGAAEVVITRGSGGVAARTDDGRFVANAATVLSGNPTGAGDAFTAGLAAAIVAGLDWPSRLRRAAAWAAAAIPMPTAGELDPVVAASHEARTIIEQR